MHASASREAMSKGKAENKGSAAQGRSCGGHRQAEIKTQDRTRCLTTVCQQEPSQHRHPPAWQTPPHRAAACPAQRAPAGGVGCGTVGVSHTTHRTLPLLPFCKPNTKLPALPPTTCQLCNGPLPKPAPTITLILSTITKHSSHRLYHSAPPPRYCNTVTPSHLLLQRLPEVLELGA